MKDVLLGKLLSQYTENVDGVLAVLNYEESQTQILYFLMRTWHHKKIKYYVY